MNKQVEIYGERNTGTNYLEQLVELNFNVKLLRGTAPKLLYLIRIKNEWIRDTYFDLTFPSNLGWKHAMAPSYERLDAMDRNDVVFLTLTKNPYSWLLSMYKRPYHFYGKQISSFDEFLQTPWPTRHREGHPRHFKNPIEMWNCKNASYLRLMT